MYLGPLSPLQAMDRSTAATLVHRGPARGARRRALLAAALAALIALAASLLASLQPFAASTDVQSPARSFAHPHPRPLVRRGARADVASLPVAAQAQIAGALAAHQAAYGATASGAGLRLANRAQGLTASFGRSGAALAAGDLGVRVSLQSVGFGASAEAVRAATPTAHANRVGYARGPLSESYRDSPLGLEQGFAIAHAPRGVASGPLTLTMSLSGNAVATLARDARSVVLRHGSTALTYGALVASDAAGRTLRSSLALSAGRLLIRVDAAHARYPLTIDPLVQKGGKLSGGNEAGEIRFGASAALSGDGSTALIGAPQDNGGQGAVYVFARQGEEWVQQGGKLTAPQAVEKSGEEGCVEESAEEAGECEFGGSVALSADGNTALIGEPSATSMPGIAWVFTREGSTWKAQAPLSGEANAGGEGRFGKSVALSADGNTALVGDPSAVRERGAAWLFSRSHSTWTRQPALLDSEASRSAHFGRSVALSGDGNTALIGGPGDSSFVGAAWTFTRSEPGWIQGAKLTGSPSDGEAGHFGKSVALSSDGATALVGAQEDSGGHGAVWTYARSGAAFVQQGEKLTPPPQFGEGHFGTTLALSGDGSTALIGAPRAETGTGAVTVFTRSGSTWAEQKPRLGGSEAVGKGFLGSSVALSIDGEVATIGASRDAHKAGAAWIFTNESQANVPGPAVANVAPGHGPTEGGTKVTITGSNFNSTTTPTVMFGTTPASGVEVRTAAEIRAVTPPGAERVVDVTVQTVTGTSAVSAGDTFRYESPVKVHGKEKGSSGATSTTGNATPSAASGGVLGSVQAAAAACRVSLRSKHLMVAQKTTAAVRLLRTGAGSCRGTVILRRYQRTGKRVKLMAIGSAHFSIAPGRSQVVKIKLNALGRRLFARAHGNLDASIAVLRTTPAPKQAKTASVRLSVMKARKPAPAGH